MVQIRGLNKLPFEEAAYREKANHNLLKEILLDTENIQSVFDSEALVAIGSIRHCRIDSAAKRTANTFLH